MLWQFFSLPGIENGIEYRYFSRYRIEVRNSSIVTTLVARLMLMLAATVTSIVLGFSSLSEYTYNLSVFSFGYWCLFSLFSSLHYISESL